MSEITDVKRLIARRLLPLYVAAFFQGFVFWYAIEKLFMRSIGFDDAAIGLMVAVYSAAMLLVETPSGILADRWSRKGVLILASLALVASSLIAGVSNSIPLFIVSSIFWGIFYALYSGTYDSIVYDTVLETSGSSKLFNFFYGRVKILDSIALATSSLVGGLLANAVSLRSTYFLSVIAAVFAIAALVAFREPQLHKAEAAKPVEEQIRLTFRAILRNPHVAPFIIVLIALATILYTVFEFGQLWLLALATPTIYYGFANAALLSSSGLGGLLAGRFKISRFAIMTSIAALMVIASASLVFLRDIIPIVATQVLLCTLVVAVSVVFNRLMHDQLASNIRAGAASAVSTLSRLIIIPLSLLFGYVSREYSIFNASFIIFVMTLIVAFYIIKAAMRNGRRGLEPVDGH